MKENTTPSALTIEASPEAKKKGRPLGWRPRFNVFVSTLLAEENKRFFNILAPVTLKNEIKVQRSQEEITEVFMNSSPEQKTDPTFLMSLPFKTINTGEKLGHVCGNLKPEDLVTVSRKDVIDFFTGLSDAAVKFLEENAIND